MLARKSLPLTILSAAYLLLALLYNLANPPYEATDELRHFRYARYIAEYHALPEQTTDPARSAQAHHPPLYYVTVALAAAWAPDPGPVFFDLPTNPNWGYRYYEVGADNKNQYLHGDEETWPPRGPILGLFIGRLISTLFGLGTIIFVYALARELAPDHPVTLSPGHNLNSSGIVPMTAASLVAFNPMFLHLSASLNNDVPAAFFAAWALWLCAVIVRTGSTPRRELALGAALGLGLMTKTNDAALIFPALLALLAASGRSSTASSGHLVAVSAYSKAKSLSLMRVGTAVLLISAWWFVRNYALYGDLTGSAQYVAAWRGQADRARLFGEMLSNLPYAWTTVWGRFNYGQIPLPDAIYRLGGWAITIALLGWGVALLTQSGRTAVRSNARAWVVLLAAVATVALFWGALMLSIPATANARMMFPAYPALAVMLGWGWAFLMRMVGSATGVASYKEAAGISATGVASYKEAAGISATGVASYKEAAGISATGVASYKEAAGISATGVASYKKAAGLASYVGWVGAMLAVWGLAVVGLVTLRAAYARPRAIAGLPSDATPLVANYFNTVELLGYRISGNAAHPGDRVGVTLYWRPLARTAQPLTVFVHLLNPDGLLVAQRDTYPGLGNYPTTIWNPGVIFADTYPVHISDTAYAPDTAEWRVGLYDAATGERVLVLGPAGEAVSDAATLRDFTLLAKPSPEGVPNPVEVNFADRAELAGYALDHRVVRPGESFGLTTFWRATAPDSDYWIFAHVVGNDGRIWAISDSAISPPATTWPPGATVPESRVLTLAPDTPPGLYTLDFGLTRRDHGEERLAILAADGHAVGDHLPLTTIRVINP